MPPCLWKNCLSWNQYPVPKKAGDLCIRPLMSLSRLRALPFFWRLGQPRAGRSAGSTQRQASGILTCEEQRCLPWLSPDTTTGLTAQTGVGSFFNVIVTVVLFIVLLIYGCTGSSLLCGLFSNPGEGVGLLSSFPARDSCCCCFCLWGAWVQYVGFSSCGSQTLEHRLSSCGAQA